ncbi:MAG: porin, partial [Deltaproteobacteria bacterium]|nr:porin [Deltaproteobacteria bacterium]
YGDLLEIYVQSEFQENQDITALGVNDSSSGSDFTLLDAVIRFNFNNAFHLNVGKFKYNLSRENLEACEMPLTLDRSLFIRAPYTTTRDKGVGVWGNLLEDRFQYRFDIMNGRTATTENGPEPESDFRYTGRVHVTLLDPENTYGYKGTYLGERQVLTLGASYQYEPGVAYSDTVALTGKSDYKGWTADLFFEYPLDAIGTVTFSAAYEDIDLDDTYKGANPDPDAIGINGEKNGYYMKAGYMLPNLPLQFFARYEKWEFARLNDTYDQKINWYGIGANYYIRGQNLKVTAEYSRTDFDKEDANSRNFNTFVTQLQLIF